MSIEYIQNHRKRIKQRFSSSNDIADLDLLELILTYGIPRRDTRLIAKDLLRQHGTLLDILTNIDSVDVPYVKEHCKILLKSIHQVSARLAYSKINRNISIQSIKDIVDFFKITIAAKPIEELYIVFLCINKLIIKYELISIGTINCVHAHPREIMKKCLNIAASSIILVHNHPSGNIKPSTADIEFTLSLKKMLSSVNISIFDHIIITHNTYFSMKEHNIV